MITDELYLGIAEDGPAMCIQVDPQTITLRSAGSNGSVPLRYQNVGVFSGRGRFDNIVGASEINIKTICNTLGYKYYKGEAGKTPLGNRNVEIVPSLETFWDLHFSSESWISITCFIPGFLV